MRFAFLHSAIIACVLLIFYFSWVPSPLLALVGYLPVWLANWVDEQQNENLRTAVPFLLLGLLAGYWLAMNRRTWRWWVIGWISLIGIVFFAELGQLALPLRNFDWRDIGWGAGGAFFGLLFSSTLTLFPTDGKRNL